MLGQQGVAFEFGRHLRERDSKVTISSIVVSEQLVGIAVQ
jgi:hypothetical protein